jgi:hypothetical protein
VIAEEVDAFEEQVKQTARSNPYATLTLVDWLRVPPVLRGRARDAFPRSLRRPSPTKGARRPRAEMTAQRAEAVVAQANAKIVFDARTAPRTVALLTVASGCVNDTLRFLGGRVALSGPWTAVVEPVRDIYDEIVHQAAVVAYGPEVSDLGWRFPGWQRADEAARVEEFEVMFAAGALLSQMTMPLRLAWQQQYPLMR